MIHSIWDVCWTFIYCQRCTQTIPRRASFHQFFSSYYILYHNVTLLWFLALAELVLVGNNANKIQKGGMWRFTEDNQLGQVQLLQSVSKSVSLQLSLSIFKLKMNFMLSMSRV